MQCPNCGASLPSDANFCIECGAPITQAATGATQRIEREAGPRCPACQTVNPAEATFCVHCGRALNEQSTAPIPTPIPLASLDTPQPLAQAPAPPSSAPMPPAPRGNNGWALSVYGFDTISGAIFVLGLVMLFLTGWWWPGIIVVLGLSGFVSSLERGRPNDALQTLFWTIGIAVIAVNNWWWPGMLVLFGLSFLFGSATWRKS